MSENVLLILEDFFKTEDFSSINEIVFLRLRIFFPWAFLKFKRFFQDEESPAFQKKKMKLKEKVLFKNLIIHNF